MNRFLEAAIRKSQLPELLADVDALLGFRLDLARGSLAVANPTRASSMRYRQAPRFCRQGVGR